MITDPWRLVLALPLVALGWIGVLSGTLWATGTAPAVLVILPPAGLLRHLPPDTAIASVGPYSVTLVGGDRLVPALYKAGVRMILPSGLTGCGSRRAGAIGISPRT